MKNGKVRGPGRRGKWAGYPSTRIAGLMGCSVYTAKKRLYGLKDLVGQDNITEDMIGDLIYQYRLSKDLKESEKEFKRIRKELDKL